MTEQYKQTVALVGLCCRYIIFSLVLTLVGAFFIAPANAAPAPKNFVSFMVPGSGSTQPLAINDHGDVTGWYGTTRVTGYNGFIRDQHGNFTTFQFPGSNETTPVSINVHGEVTGYAGSYGPPWQGFVRSRGGVFSSINVPGSTSVWPVKINAGGIVVGYYSTASNFGLPYYGFIRYPNGTVTTYNVPQGTYTMFTSINDAEEILGSSSDTGSFTLSPSGVFTAIYYGGPESINQEGSILGLNSSQEGYVLSYTGTGVPSYAVPAGSGGSVTLFTVPGATIVGAYMAINNQGTVMGSYSDAVTGPASNVAHGFIRASNGVITSFDPPNSNNTTATSLNNANVITGFYYTRTSAPAQGFLRFPTTGVDVGGIRSHYPHTPVVVFIGDSITQQWIGSQQSAQPTWINEGLFGSTGSMLSAFQDNVIALHPDIVHILGGTDDITAYHVEWPAPCGTGAFVQGRLPGLNPVFETCDNVLAMANMAKAAGIKVIIGTLPPFGPTLDGAYGVGAVNGDQDMADGLQLDSPQLDSATVTAYDANMVLSEHSVAPFTYATVADYYRVLNPTWATAPLTNPTDGVNPNAAGFALMTPVVKEAIAEVSSQR